MAVRERVLGPQKRSAVARWVCRVRWMLACVLKPKRAWALAGLFSMVLVGWSLRLDYLASMPALFVDDLPNSDHIQRLLVIAPHCDDEVISSAGLVQGVLARGGQVRVAIVTNGDGSFTGTMAEFKRLYPSARDYVRAGMARQEESLRALQLLGLSEEDVVFLSYPDQGTLHLWRDYWGSDRPYRSPFTKLTKSPYQRTYDPQAVYSGESLLANLRALIQEFQPDTVVAPHPADIHRDHWACGAFAALAVTMERHGQVPRLLLYLVHRLDYPLPRGLIPFAPLLPPMRLLNGVSTWGKVTLPDEWVETKGRAVELYQSQLRLLGGFLRSFVRQNELFCQLSVGRVPRLAPGQKVTPVIEEWRTLDGSELQPLMEDSAGDSVGQEIGPGGDFVALYGARVEDELWIAAKARGAINSLLAYTCVCRGISGEEVRTARRMAPRRASGRPDTEATGNYLLARFDLAELGNPAWIVVHCEAAYPGGRASDRIGWVVARLEVMEPR